MRCAVVKCEYNEGGYCSRSSYIQITEDGECDSIFISEAMRDE